MDIRSAFFSPRNRTTKQIDLVLDGEMRHLELRACSLAAREKIIKAAQDTDSVRGLQRASVLATIAFLYDPEKDARVFSDSDFELLYGAATSDRPEANSCGALIEQVAMAAAPLLRPTPSAKKCPACDAAATDGHSYCGHCGAQMPGPLEIAEKNSQTTPSNS